MLQSIKDKLGVDFFTGVPDSLLRALCDALVQSEGISDTHVVAADEGGAVALAAGHYLATGRPSMVYMQNSGIGNAVNPICSLINNKVYAIPMLFVVGWRGEPGVHDEPQHIFQGQISEELLECLDLDTYVIDAKVTLEQFAEILEAVKGAFTDGRSAALLVRKGALTNTDKVDYKKASISDLAREDALAAVIDAAPKDAAFVSTTGKLSRELFELREAHGESHDSDFLTVGSMGHSSMIGLGVALAQPNNYTFVLDGDGAVLMHAGALAVVASRKPKKFIHVLFNNVAHESVGGMPTVSSNVNWCELAAASGYGKTLRVTTKDEIANGIKAAAEWDGPVFVEIVVAIGSRADLGRPTTSAYDNGKNFSAYLKERN